MLDPVYPAHHAMPESVAASSSSSSSGGAIRDAGREDRLQWSKRAEHRLEEELKQIALRECDQKVKDFVECSKTAGLLVTFKCRSGLNEMNECLHQYTNKQRFEEYKREREMELATAQNPPH